MDAAFRWRWALVPALAALGALIGLLVALLGSPNHRAEASVLISSRAGPAAAESALPDVHALATGGVLAGNVRSTLRIGGSDEDFRRRLHVTVRPRSHVIVFSVSDRKADRARQIAQEAAVVLTQLVKGRFGKATPPLDATILDSAHVVASENRHVARDLVSGAVLGLLVAFAVLAAAGRRAATPADTRAADRALREREALLERRLREVGRRELSVAQHAGRLAVRERALAEAVTPSAEPLTPALPEPAPEPAVATPPAAAPAAARPVGAGGWNLRDLERLVADHPDAPAERREEWRTYIFFLREHAAVDGALPESFDTLVSDVFADLVET